MNTNLITKKFFEKGFVVIKRYISKKELNDFEKQLICTYSKNLKIDLNKSNIHQIINSKEKSKSYDLLYNSYKKYVKTSPYKKIEKKLSLLSKKLFNKNYKYLNSGIAIGLKSSKRTAYDWHQEQSYYSQKNTVHYQFPILKPANKKNGTMSVLVGSHKLGSINKVKNIKRSKKSINTFKPKNILSIKKRFKEKFINLHLGDICLFNENIIHKSNKNFTNTVRFVPIVRLQLKNSE